MMTMRTMKKICKCGKRMNAGEMKQGYCHGCLGAARMVSPCSPLQAEKTVCPWPCLACGKTTSIRFMMAQEKAKTLVTSNGQIRTDGGWGLVANCLACQNLTAESKVPGCAACGKQAENLVAYTVGSTSLKAYACADCASKVKEEGISFINFLRKEKPQEKIIDAPTVKKAEAAPPQAKKASEMLASQIETNRVLVEEVARLKGEVEQVLEAAARREEELLKAISEMESAAAVAASVEEMLRGKVEQLENEASRREEREEQVPDEVSEAFAALAARYEEVMGEPMPA